MAGVLPGGASQSVVLHPPLKVKWPVNEAPPQTYQIQGYGALGPRIIQQVVHMYYVPITTGKHIRFCSHGTCMLYVKQVFCSVLTDPKL